MDRNRTARLLVLGTLVISVALCGAVRADDTASRWEDGTWKLVKRTLPDGTVLTPPTVQGLSTNKNGTNQLVVFWQTPEGKPASISQLFQYQMSDTEMTATPILTIFDDGSGKPPAYTIGGDTKSVPVKREGGRVSHQHPLNPPFLVIEGDHTTATLEGAFVDEWEKVR
jgi:hypothetical protein